MRAGIYIRVSTEEQKKKGYSLPEQIDRCIKKAIELGATEWEIFSEEGESAGYLDRPELEKLIGKIKSGSIQLFVTLDTDRLSRDLGDQIAIANEIEKYAKLDFVVYSRGDPNNPEDNLFFHIKGAFAQYERAKIRRNTIAGRRRKALSGKIVMPGGWTGHAGPYGYRYVDNNMEINENEAVVVRYIYNLAYEEGLGILRIVEKLNRENTPSPKGSIWHGSTVSRILRSETYAGIFHNYKYKTEMTSNRTASGKRQIKYTYRPESERISIDVPAIIDREIWEAVQAQLKRNTTNNRKRGTIVLLKSRVKCGLCGRTCAVHTNQKGRVYYRCKGTKTGIVQKCSLLMIPAISIGRVTGLDEMIWKAVREILINPESIKAHLSNNQDDTLEQSLTTKLDDLEKKLKNLTKQKDEFFNLRMEGLLDSEELKKRLIVLDKKKKDILIKISENESKLKSLKRSNEFDVDKFCNYYRSRIEKTSPAEQAKIIDELDIVVYAYPGRKFEVMLPVAGKTNIQEIQIKQEKFVAEKPISMTETIKTAIDEYCQENNLNESDVIRQAIMELPNNAKYNRSPREKRMHRTIALTQEQIDIMQKLKNKYNESYSRLLEWALERHLEKVKKL